MVAKLTSGNRVYSWMLHNYRNETYCNNHKNQQHGQNGRNTYHRTGIKYPISINKDQCTFSLAFYQDDSIYYTKTTNSVGSCQFHHLHDYLCTSTSLLEEEDLQLQDDLNLARAKLGTAANLHYDCPA